jgi:hypothetical protein
MCVFAPSHQHCSPVHRRSGRVNRKPIPPLIPLKKEVKKTVIEPVLREKKKTNKKKKIDHASGSPTISRE